MQGRGFRQGKTCVALAIQVMWDTLGVGYIGCKYNLSIVPYVAGILCGKHVTLDATWHTSCKGKYTWDMRITGYVKYGVRAGGVMRIVGYENYANNGI